MLLTWSIERPAREILRCTKEDRVRNNPTRKSVMGSKKEEECGGTATYYKDRIETNIKRIISVQAIALVMSCKLQVVSSGIVGQEHGVRWQAQITMHTSPNVGAVRVIQCDFMVMGDPGGRSRDKRC